MNAVAEHTSVKHPLSVTIPRHWQLVFIATIIASQLISIIQIAWSMIRISHYVSSGTLIFQITSWLYPALYLLAAYLFLERRVRPGVPRLFWAVLIATVGVLVYQAANAIQNIALAEAHYVAHGGGLWNTFGVSWTLMVVVFVLFCVVLGTVSQKGKL